MSVITSERSNTFLATVSALVMVAASVTGRRKQAARKFMAMLSAMAVVVAGLTVGVAGPAQATTAIGDVGPGGGIVFITPTTAGNSTGKFFEAAPNTWDGSAPDGTARWCQSSNANISGLGTAIGTGVTNSETIDTTCTSTGTDNAAEYVRAKTIGGFSDWFLPSRDEMSALYDQRALLTGVYATNQAGESYVYLTSSQGKNVFTATAVFMQGAPTGQPGTFVDTAKQNFSRSLRPVRMFEPSITPSVGTVSATVNTAITQVTFAAAGFGAEVITYTVAPTLPAGLSLNAGTGAISGTPTAAIAAANYVVTATGNAVPATTATATINITVAAASITPSVGTVSATVNTAITPVTFAAAGFGAEVITYTVAPTLPTGLSLNAGTGAISGTPTAAIAAANYVVTATGGVTTATATVNITVAAAPAPAPAPAPDPVTPATPVTPVTPVSSPTAPETPVAPVALSPAQFMLGLTPTQVQGFTADELAALPPAAFAVMSPAQVKALNPAQVIGFSATQIQAIPARSLRAMKPITLKKFSVTQIRDLTNAQASGLRAKQIKALGPVKRKIVDSKR